MVLRRVICCLAVLAFASSSVRADERMASSDGNVVASLSLNANQALQYTVDFKGVRVVEASSLGITIDGIDLGIGVTLGKPQTAQINETYSTRGHQRTAENRCDAWSFPVIHQKTGRKYEVKFRVYDDGVAFRYLVPSTSKQHVDRESSSWKVIANSKTWFFERLTKKWKLKSYAGEWISTDISNLNAVSPVGPIQGTPLVFELPSDLGYAAITKAATYNYSGMRLEAIGNRTLVANFTEGTEGFDVNGTVTTPWRVTLLADDLNELATSNLITNLNPAPDSTLFADSGFIRPGRCVWSWETLGLGTPDTQRSFIDLAAELGFEYSLVDDGWIEWTNPWETIASLCDYGKTKGVGVWVWIHSRDLIDPRNDYQTMQRFFERVAECGAVGAKIDFMNGESKALVDFEIAALRLAAERKLMINFHGCHASTGESRTWPNEMTREGIRGIEVNKMKEGPLPASHNAALPFTRFVTGHGDYTPVLYSNPGPTTWAHQLATAIAFTSPIQIYAEHPNTMLRWPVLRNACEITKAIPSVWDETRVLNGSQIGELAAMARRKGNNWFVSLLNGNDRRNYSLDLAFLSEGSYTARTVRDDFDATPVLVSDLLNQKADLKEFTKAIPFKVETDTWKKNESIQIQLAKNGGYVAIIEPIK